MKTLCIDCSKSVAKICLDVDGDITLLNVESPHSENLMPNIDKLLGQKDIDIKSLDVLACVVGPGSFTGVRIAVATIKGMAVVNRSAKIIGISNFDLVAKNVSNQKEYYVVLDSGNIDSYIAKYEFDECKNITYMQKDLINSFALNNKVNVYCDKFEKEKLEVLDANFIEVKDDTMNLCLQGKIDKNEFIDLNDLKPLYVKLSQAEKARSEKILGALKIVDVKDYDDVKNIENACFSDDVWSEKTFSEELMQLNKHYFVASYEKLNIGYIGYEVNGDDANLQKVAVLEDYREIGVAGKLLEVIEYYIKKAKLKNLFLEVDEKNEKAISFYKKHGFEVYSKRENYYKNGNACLLMKKVETL